MKSLLFLFIAENKNKINNEDGKKTNDGQDEDEDENEKDPDEDSEKQLKEQQKESDQNDFKSAIGGKGKTG